MFGQVLRAIDNGSITKAKSNGLKGQPWWVPLCKLKYSEFNLFVMTEALGEEYKSLTHDTNSFTKTKVLQDPKQIWPFHPIEYFLRI